MRSPNFVVIGAGKAGTTSLNHYLSSHPEIFMSPVKEPNYFALAGRAVEFHGPGASERINRWSVTSSKEYAKLFDSAQDGQSAGEISPMYLYTPGTAARIRECVPNVKLVVVLRDPAERAFSAYQYLFYQGRETIKSFRQALEAEATRIEQNWEWIWHYLNVGFYAKQLEAYTRAFPPEQMKVFLFEELRDSPEAFFAELFQFLGVDPSYEVDCSTRYKVSTRPPSGSSLGNWYQRVLSVFRTKAMPVADREFLVDIYRDDIVTLQGMLGRELEAWLRY